MATQPITAPKPMIDPKDELIAELTGGLKVVRAWLVKHTLGSNDELDALIRKGELGVN